MRLGFLAIELDADIAAVVQHDGGNKNANAHATAMSAYGARLLGLLLRIAPARRTCPDLGAPDLLRYTAPGRLWTAGLLGWSCPRLFCDM